METKCKPILLRRFVSDETAAPTAQFILSKLIPEDKAKIMSSTPTPANSGVNWNCLMWHPKPLKLLSDMYDRTIAGKRRQLLATWVNNRSVQEAFGSVASLHQSQDQDDTHYEQLWKELVTACGKETIDNYPLCTKCSTRDCEEKRSLW